VLIIGSSFIKRAKNYLQQEGRTLLPLPIAKVTLIGHGGLRLDGVYKIVNNFLAHNPEPSTIVLHVGANDILALTSASWREALQELVLFLKARAPRATLVWSDMLQRNKWRSNDERAGEKTRKHLQVFARKIIFQEKGEVVRHDHISREEHLAGDGVHLNTAGQEIFLMDLALRLIEIMQNQPRRP
jgi:lysophospholipase L1-like esterase